MTFTVIALALCSFIMIMNFISMGIMAKKCKARQRTLPVPSFAPPVSIIRPLRNIEQFSEETLHASFSLNYPQYELIFCVQSANDPIIPVVEGHIRKNPHINAVVLIGDNVISANPKLNNCVKGWEYAKHDYVILADSNALMPPDYIQTMLAAFDPGTAMSVSMPIGSRPGNFWAIVECAILNTFQARWQYGAEAIGIGFAQGKNMMWKKEILDRAGGISALASEIAEDAASTKVIRAQNLDIHLVDMPFEQPLGTRMAREVYDRHARWARLRRATFPLYFVPEFMNGSFIAAVTGAFAAIEYGYNPLAVAILIVASLHIGEIILAKICGFFVDWRMPFALIVRDIMLPVMFIDALLIDEYVWHGEKIKIKEADEYMGLS